jgi:hypothetical protein
MPLASSNDLILAGLHDITQALQHPSPGSPLAPLTDSHVAALQQLNLLLTNVCPPHSAAAPYLSSAPTWCPISEGGRTSCLTTEGALSTNTHLTHSVPTTVPTPTSYSSRCHF